MRTRIVPACFLLLLVSACGSETPEPASTAAAAAKPELAALPRTASVAGASVYFISPADGDTVSNPVSVVFGIEGMQVVPAGENAPHSGHHHLLIDTGLPDLGLPIPKDAQHVHLGTAGQRPKSRWNRASTRCKCFWETTCISRTTHRSCPIRLRFWLNKVLSDKAWHSKIAGL